MKTLTLVRLLSILLLWSLSSNSYAQQWYHVELIVFEQLDNYTNEVWPESLSRVDAPLSPSVSGNRIHPSKNSTLLNTAATLNKSPQYRVHYHRSWQQPIMRKGSAQAISIQSGDGSVEGAIRLYKATYLHASLDLRLAQFSGFGTPQLIESRRVRSKKLYYFDHPTMGALLKLTPI